MKKKSLLISGLLFLGAAIGFTSYAVSSGLPGFNLIAEGDEEEDSGEETEITWSALSITQSEPAQNGVVLSTENLQYIYVYTNMGGDKGLSFLTNVEGYADKNIVIYKNDEVLETINVKADQAKTTRKRQIALNPKVNGATWDNAFSIKLSSPASEPASYKVEIPDYILGGVAFSENGDAGQYNPAYTLNFTVKKALPITWGPVAGDVSVTGLNTVTITYPEGTVVAKNASGAAPQLWHFATGTDSQTGTYSVSCADNVVTLTLASGEVEPTSQNITQNYYHIVVPAGGWTITSDGVTEDSPAYKSGNYRPVFFTKESFVTIPAVGVAAPAADFKTLTIVLNDGVYLNNESAYVTLSFYDVKGQKSTPVQYYNATQEGNKVTMTTNITSTYPGVEYLPTCNNYELSIPAKMFGTYDPTTGTDITNAIVLIGGYSVNGINALPIKSTSPANLSVQTSVQSITYSFIGRAVFADPEKEVIVKKDGVEVNRVKVGTITTATLKDGANGSTSATLKYLTAADKESGLYEIILPAGAFKTIGLRTADGEKSYLNEEMTTTIYLNPKNPDYTVTYTPAPVDGKVTEVSEITFTYPEDCKLVQINEKPDIKFGYLKGEIKPTSYLSSAFTIVPTYDFVVENNTVTLKMTNGPIRYAAAEAYFDGCTIAASTFSIEQNGTTLPNNAIAASFQILDVYAPSWGYGSVERLGDKTYFGAPITDETVILASDITGTATNMISMKFANPCYGLNTADTEEVPDVDEDGNPKLDDNGQPVMKKVAVTYTIQLLNEAGEVVTTFSNKQVDGSLTYNRQLYLTAEQAAKIPVGTHKYTIHIPARALAFNSSSNTSALRIVNNNAFDCPISITAQGDIAKEFTPQYPDSYNFSYYNSFGTQEEDGTPYGMAAVSFTAPAGVAVNSACEGKVQLLFGEEVLAELGAKPTENGGVMVYGTDQADAAQSVVFMFDALIGEKFKQAGTYTVVIPEGFFQMEGVDMLAATLTYNMEVPALFDGTFTPYMPDSFKFTLDQSFEMDQDEYAGMGVVMVNAPTGCAVNDASTAKVQLKYEGEVIAELGAKFDEENGKGVSVDAAAQGDEVKTTVTFAFDTTGDPELQELGQYTIVIPDGFFTINGDNLLGGELTYNLVEPVAAVAFNDVFSLKTPATAEFSLDQSYGAMYGVCFGMGIIELSATGNTTINTASTAKAELYYEGKLIASAGTVMDEANGTGMEFGGVSQLAGDEPTPANKNLQIYFNSDYSNETFLKPGNYTVMFPEGIFMAGDAPVAAGKLEYTMTEAAAKEYKYTITPESGMEFIDCLAGSVVLNVEDVAYTLDYDKNPGTFTDPDGEVIEFESSFPTPGKSANGATLTWFMKENPKKPIVWKNGTYTFTIKANSIWVDTFADSGAPANFPAEDIVMTYNVKINPIEFDQVFQRNTPANEEFTLEESYKFYGQYNVGMCAITLNAADGVSLVAGSTAKADLYKNGQKLLSIGVGLNEDGEGIKMKGNVVTLIFWSGLYEELMEPADYTVVLPEGLFKAGAAPVLAGTLNYTLKAAEAKEYTWTITPVDNTEFDGYLSGNIVLTIDGASTIYYGDGVGGVYSPEGKRLLFSRYPEISGNTLTWTLSEDIAKDKVEWVKGAYTFKINKNTLWVDTQDPDVFDVDANFPTEDIVVTYIVNNPYTAVAVIGIEAADSYNVYTVDGKAVLLNGNADQLIELESGLYIINGKKAYIRK